MKKIVSFLIVLILLIGVTPNVYADTITNIIPKEVTTVTNVIAPYVKSGNLKYSGLIRTQQGDQLNLYVGQNTLLYKFYTEDNYGISMDNYFYDPYSGFVYKVTQSGVETTHTGINISVNTTQNDAIQLTKDYLKDNNKYITKNYSIDSDFSNIYVVRCHDDMGDHDVTYGWYYVDKTLKIVIPMY